MYARAASGTVVGVEAQPVVVESFRGKGLPGTALIGLARGAVREAVVRVRSAIGAAGLQLGSHRLVVNLLPAELPKETSGLDLPLAVSLLASGGELALDALGGRRFFGELTLDGRLERVSGAVLLADLARQCGDTELIVPKCCAQEASIIPGVRVLGAASLAEVVDHLRGVRALPAHGAPAPCASERGGCFSQVSGQARAKRALEIAAAGNHNVLLIGPPGSGKTMLARLLPGILPPLTPEESIEVTRIHSAAGLLDGERMLTARPFRAPHHTASEAALCGGGSIPRPGEVTLAHRGVLFLDELPEYPRRALESLREPLEEGEIRIARARMCLRFPAQVLLVAAMNPCPCGKYDRLGARAGHRAMACTCTYDQVHRYQSRLSGPLLDRIDLHVLVEAVPFRDYATGVAGEPSAAMRARVQAARAAQRERFGQAGKTNACMDAQETRRFVPLDDGALHEVEEAMHEHGLSARAIGRATKVARTLADLVGSPVTREHVREALNFRILDRCA